MNNEVVETQEIKETKDYCKHPFDVLLRDETGYWNCMCGSVGSLGWDFDGKLKFIIPGDTKPTRQQRRKWERQMTKDYLKRKKKLAKTTT